MKIKNFVQLSSNSTRVVSLDEWVLKKKHMIEYTVGLKENIGCQQNVRDMEDELFEKWDRGEISMQEQLDELDRLREIYSKKQKSAKSNFSSKTSIKEVPTELFQLNEKPTSDSSKKVDCRKVRFLLSK